MSRVIAIGDIHANYYRLKKLLDKINLQNDDQLIFLGDYTDRGTATVDTVKLILKLSKLPNVTCLKGNHEDMMLEYFNDHIYDDWLYNGGQQAYDDLIEYPELFNEYINFAKTLKIKHELVLNNKKYIFVHAGMNPSNPDDEFSNLWIREYFYNNYKGNDIYVVGHTPTIYFDFQQNTFTNTYSNKDFLPVKLHNNIYCIDTGSYYEDGFITAWCYDLDTNKISCIQSGGK